MSDVEIKVNSDMIKSIVEGKIQSAVLSALNTDPTKIIEAMVQTAINYKVDSSGQRSRYDHDNRYNWVEAEACKAIREAAQKTLKTWVEGQQDAIEKAITKELTKQRGAMIEGFIKSFISQAGNTYGFKVEVTPRIEK